MQLHILCTINPQISSLGAYLFLDFLHGGLFEGVLIPFDIVLPISYFLVLEYKQ